jgi:hypothetical protein
MARKYIELSGPLFDADVQSHINLGVAEGIEKLADTAAGILAGFVSAAGFVKTGAFLQSIDSKLVRSGNSVGYMKIAPTDVWPTPGRPTRTWFEAGTRGGKKLRKANGGFSKTTTRVNTMSYEMIESALVGRLE